MSGNIKIWQDPDKVNELIPEPAPDPSGKTIYNFTLDQFIGGSKTYWVEATARSQSLQDIELQWGYFHNHDHVRMTAVWAGIVAAGDVKHNNGDANFADFPMDGSNINPEETYRRALAKGYGLRPTGAFPLGVRNAIGFRYTLLPAGIQNIERVKFDLTRQKHRKVWLDGTLDEASSPGDDETANDDPTPEDDESYTPIQNIMFQLDGPGANVDDATGHATFVYRGNFDEYARVKIFPSSIGAHKPSGNGLKGSRCSKKYP